MELESNAKDLDQSGDEEDAIKFEDPWNMNPLSFSTIKMLIEELGKQHLKLLKVLSLNDHKYHKLAQKIFKVEKDYFNSKESILTKIAKQEMMFNRNLSQSQTEMKGFFKKKIKGLDDSIIQFGEKVEIISRELENYKPWSYSKQYFDENLQTSIEQFQTKYSEEIKNMCVELINNKIKEDVEAHFEKQKEAFSANFTNLSKKIKTNKHSLLEEIDKYAAETEEKIKSVSSFIGEENKIQYLYEYVNELKSTSKIELMTSSVSKLHLMHDKLVHEFHSKISEIENQIRLNLDNSQSELNKEINDYCFKIEELTKTNSCKLKKLEDDYTCIQDIKDTIAKIPKPSLMVERQIQASLSPSPRQSKMNNSVDNAEFERKFDQIELDILLLKQKLIKVECTIPKISVNDDKKGPTGFEQTFQDFKHRVLISNKKK